MRKFFRNVGIALGVGLAAVASAQTFITTTTSAGNGTFTVSATDLANAGQPSFSSLALASGSAAFGSAPGMLLDGSMYDGSGAQDSTFTFIPSTGGAELILTFDTTLNPFGYDLSAIDVYTGTGQNRGVQNYTVAFAAPGSSVFTTLYSVDNEGSTAGSVEVLTHTVASGGAGLLASGVGSLRFTFRDATTGAFPESMYRELDVFGVTAVPEPSVGALLLLGVATLGMIR